MLMNNVVQIEDWYYAHDISLKISNQKREISNKYLLQIPQDFGQSLLKDLFLQLSEVAFPTTHLDWSLHPPNVHNLLLYNRR